MPERWINWELLGNPYNWLAAFLMLAFPMILITVIHAHRTQG